MDVWRNKGQTFISSESQRRGKKNKGKKNIERNNGLKTLRICQKDKNIQI